MEGVGNRTISQTVDQLIAMDIETGIGTPNGQTLLVTVTEVNYGCNSAGYDRVEGLSGLNPEKKKSKIKIKNKKSARIETDPNCNPLCSTRAQSIGFSLGSIQLGFSLK